MNEVIIRSETSDKNFFLIASMLGVFGVHRFYCGKIKSDFHDTYNWWIGHLGI